MIKKITMLIFLIIMSINVNAQENIVDFDDKSLPVLNEELKKIRDRAEDKKILTSEVTGVLPVLNGGTGLALNTSTQGAIWYDDGTNNFQRLAVGASGKFLKTNGASSNPSWASPTLDLSLSSTTSLTSVSNSGDIAISTDKTYMVVVHIEAGATTGSNTDILINNDTGSNYKWYKNTIVFTGTPSNTFTASVSDSKIPIGVAMWNGTSQYKAVFYIDTYKSNSITRALIKGDGFNIPTGQNEMIEFHAQYSGSAVSSFRIVGSAGVWDSIDVKLYEFI